MFPVCQAWCWALTPTSPRAPRGPPVKQAKQTGQVVKVTEQRDGRARHQNPSTCRPPPSGHSVVPPLLCCGASQGHRWQRRDSGWALCSFPGIAGRAGLGLAWLPCFLPAGCLQDTAGCACADCRRGEELGAGERGQGTRTLVRHPFYLLKNTEVSLKLTYQIMREYTSTQKLVRLCLQEPTGGNSPSPWPLRGGACDSALKRDGALAPATTGIPPGLAPDARTSGPANARVPRQNGAR